MSSSTAHILAATAMGYGVAAALAGLLQVRAMLDRRASCDVSARFFAAYAGGYAIWLLYGLGVGSVPLIVVDAVGLLCGGLTLGVALALRGSLLHPSTWTSCPATQQPHTAPMSPGLASDPASANEGQEVR
jgi:uncharacterized protein with PQ loop repeat